MVATTIGMPRFEEEVELRLEALRFAETIGGFISTKDFLEMAEEIYKFLHFGRIKREQNG